MKLSKLTILLFVFAVFQNSYAGFFDDVKEAVKHPKKVPKRIVKQVKRTPTDVKKLVKKGEEKISKADDKISTAWNEWREEEVDPIGDYIATAYKYLKAGHKGNPDGFLTQGKSSISNPDIEVTLNQGLVTKLLNQFISEQVPLDKDNPNNGDYFYFDDVNFSNDANRRIIVLKIARGRLKFKFVTGNTLKVNGATMEFLPKIRKTKDKLFLDLHARMTYLNVDDVPPMVERGIAHGINDHMKNKDASNGFMSVDLTGKFGKSINMPTIDKDSINISLSEASIYIEGSTLIYQAKLSVNKE